MKVMLVFPGISESGFNKTGKRHKLVWLNHGLASISSSLKKNGHEVSLADLRQLCSWDEFADLVKNQRPDVAGITMMSVDYGPGIRSARAIKEASPKTRVVVGGAHPSLCPEDFADNPDIDHIFQGEGELTFNDLIDDIAHGRISEKVIRSERPDLDSIPFADREIFGAGEMPIDHFLRIPFVTIIAGRGCMYNCSFCQPAERAIFGTKVRRRSVANVIEELRILRDKQDFQSLMIHDDCLTEDRAWVTEFCERYIDVGFRRPFVCQSRADIICKNEDMVKLMAKAGLAMFLIGFESGNQRVLGFLRKGTKVEQNFEANRICRKHGIRVWANYMLGIPTETKEEALDTLRMIQKIKPYRASPAFFTPHPGSDLYKYCVDKGLSLIRDYRDYARSSENPKIRGVDYNFLKEVLEESRKVPFSVRVRRKLDHTVERKIKKHVGKFINKIKMKKVQVKT